MCVCAQYFLPYANKVLFLVLSMTFLFVCEWNTGIWGTAERICAKFTVMTCLVSSSDEFECQGQTSNVKVTRDKTGKTAESSPLTVHYKACAVRRTLQVTSRSSRRHNSVAVGVTGWRQCTMTAACMRFVFGKTSLALVIVFVFYYSLTTSKIYLVKPDS